jgi:hypothetical protein
MSDPTSAQDPGAAGSREQMMSAMFAHLIMQHTNMALIFLGQIPNPQTGQTTQDIDHARFFIDQLEMLEAKTKGNLDKQEEAILKQSLTSLRLAFVEAVNHPQPAPATSAAPPSEDSPAAPATDEQETPVNEPILPGETPPPPDVESKSRKIFSKKYS